MAPQDFLGADHSHADQDLIVQRFVLIRPAWEELLLDFMDILCVLPTSIAIHRLHCAYRSSDQLGHFQDDGLHWCDQHRTVLLALGRFPVLFTT